MSRSNPVLDEEGYSGNGYVFPVRYRRLVCCLIFALFVGICSAEAERNLGECYSLLISPHWLLLLIPLAVLIVLVGLSTGAGRRSITGRKNGRFQVVPERLWDGPVCQVCGTPLIRPTRCRKCDIIVCPEHLSPVEHNCSQTSQHSSGYRKILLVSILLVAFTSPFAYFIAIGLVFPEIPEPLVPRHDAGLLHVEWLLDLSENLTQVHHGFPMVTDLDGDGANEILLA